MRLDELEWENRLPPFVRGQRAVVGRFAIWRRSNGTDYAIYNLGNIGLLYSNLDPITAQAVLYYLLEVPQEVTK